MGDEQRRACRNCGTSLAPSNAFCTHCGTRAPEADADADSTVVGPPGRPLVPPPPSAPPAPGFDETLPRRPFTPLPPLPPQGAPALGPGTRGPAVAPFPGALAPAPHSPPANAQKRRSPVLMIIGVIAAIALLAGGAALGVVMTGSDDPEASTTAAESEGEGDEEAPPAEQISEGDTESQSATPQQSEPEVECWDGSTRARRQQCPRLAGRAAMDWIFSGVSLSTCRQRNDGFRLRFECRDGGEIRYNFSQWTSAGDARDYYQSEIGGAPRTTGGGQLRWDGFGVRRSFKTAVLYPGQPYAVTVYADSAAERDALIRGLAMRPARAVDRHAR